MASSAEERLESRIRSLELSVRRAHRLAVVLGVLLLVTALGAWRAEDKVETGRLVLTDGKGIPAVVLRAGTVADGGSLVLESPGGAQIMRLGRPSVRSLGR